MKYVQVSFNCKPNTETITDVLASDLADIGFESFVKTEIGMDAYIPKEFFSEDKTQQLVKDFMLEADISFIPKELEDRNWNAEWEQNYFQPIVISDDCLIQSSFHNVEGNYKYRILINPKMAFGAGNHQTTSLLLRQILNMDLYKKAILDMGCGTAVLAILASMKGADPVMGIDIDEWAYNNAVENVKLNKVTNIKLLLGGAEKLGKNMYDVIFANINRNILLRDIPAYVKVLNHNGMLILSGFYKEDIAAISKKCEEEGLRYLYYNEQDNWVDILCKKDQ